MNCFNCLLYQQDKLTAKIATVQSFITGEVEVMTKTQVTSAGEVMSSFECQSVAVL